MKPENKLFLKTAILNGIPFAILMAGFQYWDEGTFNIYKFLFHFLGFGICMGLMARYNYKKLQKKEKKEE